MIYLIDYLYVNVDFFLYIWCNQTHTQHNTMNTLKKQQLIDLMRCGKKVNAIKLLKDNTSATFNNAIALYDKLYSLVSQNFVYYKQNPAKLAIPVKKNNDETIEMSLEDVKNQSYTPHAAVYETFDENKAGGK